MTNNRITHTNHHQKHIIQRMERINNKLAKLSVRHSETEEIICGSLKILKIKEDIQKS